MRLGVLGGLVGAGVLLSLGLGVGYVVAGSKQGSSGEGHVTICHSGNGKHFTEESPSESALLKGHAGHAHDLIPPFAVIHEGGATTQYPGKNLNTSYGARYTGGELL